MLFAPDALTFRAAPRLCLCDLCRVNYGSCELFEEYEIPVTHLKSTSVRSVRMPVTDPAANEMPSNASEEMIEFIQPGTVCAIAPAESSCDPVWFILIEAVQNSCCFNDEVWVKCMDVL